MVVAIVAAAISALGLMVEGPQMRAGSLGLCLPSPNMWQIEPILSSSVNYLLLLLIAVGYYVMNQRFNIINGQGAEMASFFLIMSCSNLWVSGRLSASVIMAAVNMVALWTLFGCYRSKNATQQLFMLGSLLSIGSMFQYGFLFLAPAYILMALTMQCLNFKGVLALLMGLVASYWIVIGLGIVPLDSFAMPQLVNFFDNFTSRQDIFVGLLVIGITAVLALLIGLNNAVLLFAGNTERRLMINSVNILGLVAFACMVCDFRNLTCYVTTFYMAAAMQFTALFSLNPIRGKRWFELGLIVVYVASGLLMMYIR